MTIPSERIIRRVLSKGVARLEQCGEWLAARPLITFMIVSLWLAAEYICLGENGYVRIHDNADGGLAARLARAYAVAPGAWSPQLVSGVDWITQGMSTTLDSYMFSSLPGWLAYGLVMWLQRFVAGYFMFRLCRDALEASVWFALYAGLAYSSFHQPTVNLSWAGFTLYDGLGLPGTPFVLWAVGRLTERSVTVRYLGAAALGVGVAHTAIFALSIFLFPVAAYWFLSVSPPRRWSLLVTVGVMAAAWTLSQSVTLWASFLNAPLSHRADWLHPCVGCAPRQFVVGQIADNALPLGVALGGLALGAMHDRRVIALLVAIVCIFGIVLVLPSLQPWLYEHAGFVAGFQIDRFHLFIPLLSLGAAVASAKYFAPTPAAGNSSDARLRRVLSNGLPIALCAAVLIQSAVVKRRTISELRAGSSYAALYRNPQLQELAAGMDPSNPFRVVTVKLADRWQHPGYVWAYGLESADGYVNLYTQRYQDFWERVIAPATAADPSWYEYFHEWGNRVYLFGPPAVRVPQGGLPFSDYFNLELLSLANVRYIISPVALRHPQLVLVPPLSVFGPARSSGRSTPNLYIYENQEVLPRFFLAAKLLQFDSQPTLLTALEHAGPDQLRSSAYVLKNDNVTLGVGGEQCSGTVSVETYTADTIVLEVRSKGRCVLIATNSYGKYWTATADGRPAKIFPVQHAFQGVVVEPGEHQFRFEYMPPYAKVRFMAPGE